MYTHCPNCNTDFEITQEYLDIAKGKVRCGQCDHVFNALENLYHKEVSEPAAKTNETIQDNPEPGPADESGQSTQENTNTLLNSPFNTETPSVPNIDIKEKMERIVASLSAATEELKNARKTTQFNTASSETLSGQTSSADKLTTSDGAATRTFTEQGNQQTRETSSIEDSLTIEQAIDEQDKQQTRETSSIEDSLTIDQAIDEQNNQQTRETSSIEDSLAVDQAFDEQSETSAADSTLDELDIAYYEDDSFETDSSFPTEHNARSVEQDDIDILNSLIDNPEQSISDIPPDNESTSANSLLSGQNNSLDEEFSSLDDEFGQLDNGEDLLAELEQLESEFLNNNQTATDTEAEDSSLTEPSVTDEDSQADYTPQASESSDTFINTDDDDRQAQENQHQDEVVPSFLSQSDSSSSGPAALLGWLAATIVLLLVLAAQYLHFNSINFSQDTTVRPLLESICPLTGCSLPLLSSPNKVVTVTHDVRTHPTINNALEIQLTFKNKAAYTQKYPVLEITFSNSVGEVIARRKFSPDEYMSKNNSSYITGLKTNQSQEINLQVVDPEPGSLLSFQFNYL